jgi:hypothetical protein
MADPGKYPVQLQQLALHAYKSTGLGDESLGAALAASDASGRDVGTSQLVQSWRMGRCAMSVGALEVLLDHAGDRAGRVIDVLARRYGHVAVRLPEASTATGLRRGVLLLGAAAGEVQTAYLAATAPESDGGEDITPGERAELAQLVDDQVRHLVELRQALVGPTAVRVAS